MKLTVQKLGINGEGIAYLDSKPVFIDGALPTEVVDVTLTSRTITYAKAKINKIIKKSNDRVEPQCPYQKDCGGCSLMHMNEKAQSYYKRQLLVEALWKYGHVRENLVRDMHESKHALEYRSACKLPVQEKNGKLVTGMYKPNSNIFVEIKSCKAHTKEVEFLRTSILHVLNKYHLTAYNPKTRKGIRYLVIRSIQNHGGCTLVTGTNKFSEELINDLMKIEGLETISQSINTNKKSTAIFGKETRVLAGNPYITVRIDDIELQLSSESFFQLNVGQAIALYHLAVDKIDPCDLLVEGYCGVGAMSLLAHKKAKSIIGIESIPQAIINANENAKKNHFDEHIRFICDDAGKSYKKISQNHTVDTLLVDPPRSGIDDAFLETILQNPPKKLIYISCNPSTLGKNLKVLKQYYQVRTVIPFDLFPNTPHVESLTVLTK